MDSTSTSRHPPPGCGLLTLVFLWVLISGIMGLLAMIGVASVLLGISSLFVDLSKWLDLQLCGQSVQTTAQKVQFTAVGAAMAVTGIGFWWLRQRGYVRAALLCYAVLMALFLVLGLESGRGDIIGVGAAGP
jgi:hypothetical protein